MNNNQDDVLDAVVTMKFVIKNVISADVLEEMALAFEDIVKELLEEEGFCGLIEDTNKIEIINIEKRIHKETWMNKYQGGNNA